ncbi:MAG: DEAD/DEAH box helicase [Kineosporiaceae bacterium]|nr:DEAD/DEAH box helicase [Kineosporiaceae bacterium]
MTHRAGDLDSVGGVSSNRLEGFAAGYDFVLDDFQLRACRALEGGRGVLVAAPTGSGKTVVGEFAVHLALAEGRKAFYTTPIKALSNQKYADLVARHGAGRVGLLTGDTAVNSEAPVVVMTTEVLRNMLYADSPTLAGLGYVVMDEVHYLADRFRGPVWEEVIIHLPQQVQIASLSATVSNAEEFGAWLAEVRGDTDVVVWEHRPVPLWQHVLTAGGIVDLFAEAHDGQPGAHAGGGEPRVNPELRETYRRQTRPGGRARGRGPGSRGPRRRPPARPEVIAMLDRAGLLPAITFVFSRAGCEAAVEQCLAGGLRLTTAAERDEISRIVAEGTTEIPEADRAVLGYRTWLEALQRGIAAHHAGLLPTFKEVVEQLFAAGLVKVVFATETLALGINMPARTVVLEKLIKWNGETHADITPAEYTQLTGRAGRRGIDIEGHAVVLWHEGLDPHALAGLASTRTYPLRSSFRPTYNMAVNLVAQVGRERARQILETSFAQYQADQGVVGLARQLRRQEEALAGYTEAMTCHLGDFAEYMALRRRIGRLEAESSRAAAAGRRLEAIASLEQLRRGDVIRIGAGRRAAWAVVVETNGSSDADGPRPTVVTDGHRLRRVGLADVPHGVEPVTRMSLPKTFDARSPHARRDLASSLRTVLTTHDLPGSRGAGRGNGRSSDDDAADQTLEKVSRLRAAMRAHPCHGCAEREDHARWAERHHKLQRDTETLRRRIDGRTNTIARVFDRVCDLLTERGYLATGTTGELEITTAGRLLRRIYTESDLLVAECLRAGLWSGLDGPGLAACVSAVVFESRGEGRDADPRLPAGAVRTALHETVRIWSELTDQEELHRLDTTREVDLNLAWAVHRWASGRGLADVLGSQQAGELSAGDFVRWCRQIIDLLGQIQSTARESGDDALRRSASAAIDGVRRGVVANSVA